MSSEALERALAKGRADDALLSGRDFDAGFWDAAEAALAVAREREQRMREALGCAEYALMTGTEDDVQEALTLIRAALVDKDEDPLR